MVTVTRSEVRADGALVVEYRMSRRFEVGLSHGLRTPTVWSGGPQFQLGSSTSLRKEGEVIPSEYDWVRGEYSVRLTLRRGIALEVTANGRRLEFPAWSTPNAHGARWLPPMEGVQYGDGIGNDIAVVAESAERKEYLRVYAGTEIEEWVR